MKKHLFMPVRLALFLLIPLFLTSFSPLVISVQSRQTTSVVSIIPQKRNELNEFSFNRASIEKAIGRKLTLKERIGLKLYKKKYGHLNHISSINKKSEAKEAKTNKNSIIAAISAGVSIITLFLFPILTLFACAAAVTFGFIALSQIKKNPEQKGKGWATASIITGFVVFFFLILIALLIALGGIDFIWWTAFGA